MTIQAKALKKMNYPKVFCHCYKDLWLQKHLVNHLSFLPFGS